MKTAIVVCCLIGILTPLATAEPKVSLGDQAAGAHESAMSRYHASKWNEAADLFDQFIAKYPTSGKIPSAYLMLARCRWHLKEADKAEQAADEVIKRFYPSRFWLYAYGTKLVKLAAAKDNDKYLDTVETMVRKASWVPRRLWGANAADPYAPDLFTVYRWPWDLWYYYSIPFANDWSADVIRMGDTPQRAARAIKILEKLFAGKADDVPIDWQHTHVCLLRQSGDTAAAETQLKTYIDGWGKDPRAVTLYVLQANYLAAAKDTKGEDAIWEVLKKDFAGYASLDTPMFQRTLSLLKAKRNEEFLQYVKEYVRLYPINYHPDTASAQWSGAFDAWFDYARAEAAKGNQGEFKNVLTYLDEVDQKNFPRLPNDGLNWRLEAAITLKDDAAATKVAEDLLGDKRWCAENFAAMVKEAGASPAVAKVVEAARAKRKVPLANATSKAAAMLKDVRARLKEEQPRFAEEIAQEMFEKYRDDDATVQCTAEMAEYYYKKALAEPRDKWMNRMVEAYPQHPLTQPTLLRQVDAERGQRNYERVGAVCDTGIRLFPGAAGKFFAARIEAFKAAQNPKGAADFARVQLGDRVNTEVEALAALQQHERAAGIGDQKSRGDQWMEAAKRLAGTRGEVYCLGRAWGEYMPASGNHVPEPAKATARALRAQTNDPQVRWTYEFAEAGILAEQQQGSAAVRMVMEQLGSQTNVRDLYGRVSYGGLAKALMTEKKVDDIVPLVKKIREVCPSQDDQLAAQWMEASALADRDKAIAVKKWLEVLDKHPYPALISSLVVTIQKTLGNTPEMHAISQKWVKEFGGAQDLVPGILYNEGLEYLKDKQLAGLSKIRGTLGDKYPASWERDDLEDRTQKTLNPPPPPKKQPDKPDKKP